MNSKKMKAKRLSIVLVSVIGCITIFTLCSPPKPVTKITFLEKIVINNEDTTDGHIKYEGDAHGGKYFYHTDSVSMYGPGTRFMIADSLVHKELIVKINMWARQGAAGGENQFAVALQKGDSIYNWTAVKIDKFVTEGNKWTNIQDSIIFPGDLIKENGMSFKIFSFNPLGKPYFDADDIEIIIEKSEQVIVD